jgi:sulfonate dioxygenase
MSTVTVTESQPTLKLRAEDQKVIDEKKAEGYRYAHLLPVFDQEEHYEPLTPFEHSDPGHRALALPNPRAVFANATVSELTPPIGSEVTGISLADLDSTGRDQIALEVSSSLPYLIRFLNERLS